MTTNSRRWVYAFAEGDGRNKLLLGGKGANLCEMTRIGLNVPPGFVITTEACLAYLGDAQRNLPAGQYALEVSSDTDSVTYGLAWEVQPGSGPTVIVRIDAGVAWLDLANLDPFTIYTIQKSNGLAGWTDAATVRTADILPATTHSWQDPAAPLPSAAFYRLRWNAIR